jgi:hypothetical protein
VTAWLRHLEQALAAEKAAAERTAAERTAAERAAAERAAAERAANRTAAERASAERAAADLRTAADDAARRQREAERVGSGLRRWGGLGAGTGVALLLGSTPFAVVAWRKADNLSAQTNVATHPDAVFGPSLQSDYVNGPTYAHAAIGLAVGGTVLVAAGALSYWVGARASRTAERRLSLAPAAGGPLLGWSF